MEYIPMASMNSGVVFCVEFQWEASVELWVLGPLLADDADASRES